MEDSQTTSYTLFPRHISLLSSYHSNNQSEALRNALDELIQLREKRTLRMFVNDIINYITLLMMFAVLVALLAVITL